MCQTKTMMMFKVALMMLMVVMMILIMMMKLARVICPVLVTMSEEQLVAIGVPSVSPPGRTSDGPISFMKDHRNADPGMSFAFAVHLHACCILFTLVSSMEVGRCLLPVI